MALRPTDLQVIFTAIRDIERIQQIQQQVFHSHQEQSLLKFQREIEERKAKIQNLSKAEQDSIKKIEEATKRKANFKKQSSFQNKQASENFEDKSEHIIDFLI